MRIVFCLLFMLIHSTGYTQDLPYTRKMLNQLTAPAFWGRGYTKDGMAKAAGFIENEFKKTGLSPMTAAGFKQPFTFPVNTFPGLMKLWINRKKLIPGKDFIVSPAAKGLKASGPLIGTDSLHYSAGGGSLNITLEEKLTWSVATREALHTEIFVRKDALSSPPKQFKTIIENLFIPEFTAVNICGMVRGTKHPDSIILITAHYDHLGGMGRNTYFPGANDNASGVSFLLSIARYYAKNPQPYTIAFICFAAEEAGLIGSRYFTENPLLPLAHIRFLINLDLVGTGEQGATVVNATTFPTEFNLLTHINDREKLLVKINPRGKAANSDHYFFSEKDVPAFFIYTQGGISAYHDVNDRPRTLPFTVYENLFKLLLFFNRSLMGLS